MKDVITDVFSELHLQSRIYFHTDFRGDYGVKVPSKRRLIRFHYVKEGRCCVEIPDVGEYILNKGSLILIPNGVEQTIKATQNSPVVLLIDVINQQGIVDGVLAFGDGEEATKLLCGYCQFDESVDHPVLNHLPSAIIIEKDELDAANHEVKLTIQLLAEEVHRNGIGMGGVLSRLLEILFIQTFRLSINQNVIEQSFVAALFDTKIASSLQLIHSKFALKWTTAQLAKEVGMSRARFAAHFAALVGIPPITYLTKWRLLKSRSLLRNTCISLQEISERCGYERAASFTRRFRQEFHITPRVYREQSRETK